MGVDPDESLRADHASAAGQRARRQRMVAAHHHGKRTASQRFFDRRRGVEARLPHCRDVARLTRSTQVALVGLGYDDVAAIDHRAVERLELLEYAGGTQRAWAQANSSPPRADVDRHADPVDVPAGNSGHG